MAYTKEQLEDNWGLCLHILDEFLRICEENGLQYQMTYGSALGAVRHGGFIPWDKNMDAGMPLPDYLKFIELCSEQDALPPDLALMGDGFHGGDARQIPRIVLKNNLIKQAHLNPNMDLSVYCPAPDGKLGRQIIAKKALLNNKAYRLKNVDKRRPFPFNVLKGLLRPVSNSLFAESFSKMMGDTKEFEKSRHVVSLEAVYGNEVFPKEWILENEQFPFEGRMVNVSAHYDDYLSTVYGPDWMTPTRFKKDL